MGTVVPVIELFSLCLKAILFRRPDKLKKGKVILNSEKESYLERKQFDAFFFLKKNPTKNDKLQPITNNDRLQKAEFVCWNICA